MPWKRFRKRPSVGVCGPISVLTAAPGCAAFIYRVREGMVEISRILHGSMNLSDHIPPNFMGDE
jgi:plasmid stabilization system protein ParE